MARFAAARDLAVVVAKAESSILQHQQEVIRACQFFSYPSCLVLTPRPQVNLLLAQTDCNLLHARRIFSAATKPKMATDLDWAKVRDRAAGRLLGDCPICITSLPSQPLVLYSPVYSCSI